MLKLNVVTKRAWFFRFLITGTLQVVKFISISRLLSIPYKWLKYRGKKSGSLQSTWSTRGPCWTGTVDISLNCIKKSCTVTGKTPLFRMSNVSNQMMSKKEGMFKDLFFLLRNSKLTIANSTLLQYELWTFTQHLAVASYLCRLLQKLSYFACLSWLAQVICLVF